MQSKLNDMIKLDSNNILENIDMAKPRIFVSSSYYDLKYIRNSLQLFIEDFGYEAVLFERGDFLLGHDRKIDESCYNEIPTANMLIMIIGGRYGAPVSSENLTESERSDFYHSYNSVTKKELQTAIKNHIPIFIFIEKNVFVEYQTYKQNIERDENLELASTRYAYVDNISIYKMISEIFHDRGATTYVQPFEKFDDIASWLKNQWANMFNEYLKQSKTKLEILSINEKIVELDGVVKSLKTYSEAIMEATKVPGYKKLIESENKRMLFLEDPLTIEFLFDDLQSVVPIDVYSKKEQIQKAFEDCKSYDSFIEQVVKICMHPEKQFMLFNEKAIKLLFASDKIKLKYSKLVSKYKNISN